MTIVLVPFVNIFEANSPVGSILRSQSDLELLVHSLIRIAGHTLNEQLRAEFLHEVFGRIVPRSVCYKAQVESGIYLCLVASDPYTKNSVLHYKL